MLRKFKEHRELAQKNKITTKGYLSDLNNCISKKIISEDLKQQHIEKIVYLPLSPSSKRRYTNSIKKYAKFMGNSRLVTRLGNLDLPTIKGKLPNITKSPQIKRLLKKTKSIEIKTILYILSTTGCRISTLVNLKVEDIKETCINFHVAKGDKPYIAILTPDTKNMIKKHIDSKYEKMEYLFTDHNGKRITSDALRLRMKRKLGKDYINPHSCRVGLATELIENGTDIMYVKDILNHSSISTTQRYVQLTPAHIQEKVKKTHPWL